jgi:DNA-binding SARP family transcriptional activator
MLATLGHAHSAAQLLCAAANLDPINEDLIRQAIHALAEIGDATTLRAQLQQLRTALSDIDEEPSTETTALAARLLPEITGTNGGRSRNSVSDDTAWWVGRLGGVVVRCGCRLGAGGGAAGTSRSGE